MSVNRPQHPPRPKHLPFWPWLIAFALLIIIVIAGVIASNRARAEKNLDHALPTTTSTTAVLDRREPTTLADGVQGAACSSTNLLQALNTSGRAKGAVLTMPQFKCVSGYALARVIPDGQDSRAYTVDYQLKGGIWTVLNTDQVNPPADGVPDDVASQLVLQ